MEENENWLDKALEPEVRNCSSPDDLWLLNFFYIVLIIILIIGVF